ncbi:MAG: sporulation protein [Oscillospiraceae bacterium]|nr:sporulation protein [Oscillospiraceae bacterium]
MARKDGSAPRGNTPARGSAGALERASRFLELPGDIVAGLPRIQIIGSSEILIENHRGILLYEQSRIHVGGSGTVIKLKGDGLAITAMNARELLIRGHLFGVDFEY